jgi:hypothetical protein
MWQSLLPFFKWSDNLWIGHAISATTWAFPLIETIHILAMAVMYAAMIIVDLRLLGMGLKKPSVPVLAKSMNPYMDWGLIVMLITGFLLFTSEALKAYANDGFRFKVIVLVPAMLFQYTLFRWVVRQDEEKRSAPLGWAVSILSTVLWVGVGIGGRAIGFV